MVLKKCQKNWQRRNEKLQSKMQVIKSTRYYRYKNALQLGTIFMYNGKTFVMSGSLSNGAYLRIWGDTKTNYPTRDCIIIKKIQV